MYEGSLGALERCGFSGISLIWASKLSEFCFQLIQLVIEGYLAVELLFAVDLVFKGLGLAGRGFGVACCG